MKTHVFLSFMLTVMAPICCASSAWAQFGPPRNDCGPVYIDGATTYCGSYTLPNGGPLGCSCFNAQTGEVCIDPNNNTPLPESQHGPGVCTTGGNFTCSAPMYCHGDSVCPGQGAACCLPQPCPANTCATMSDGCGAYEECSTAPGCADPMVLTLSPTDVVISGTTNVTLAHGFPRRTFTIVLTEPDGSTLDLTNLQADGYGNYSTTWTIEPMTFGQTGMWKAQAIFPPQPRSPFFDSNTVQFTVSQ